MKDDKEIVFRRIRGRIVPIKVNKSHIPKRRPSHSNESNKSSKRVSKFQTAGTLFGGVVASLFGGSAFAEFGAEGERARDVSKFQQKQAQRLKGNPREFPGQAKSFSKAAARSRLRSAKLFKQRNIIAGSALAIGAFAFAKGLRDIGENVKDDRLSFTEESALDLGSGAALTFGSLEAGKKMRIPRKKASGMLIKVLGKRFGF